MEIFRIIFTVLLTFTSSSEKTLFPRRLPGLFETLLRQRRHAVGREGLGFFSFDLSSYKKTGKTMKGSSEIKKEVCSLNFRRLKT